MEESLVRRLVEADGLAAIFGARIAWFGRQRGGGLPELILSKISPGREWTHDGPDGLDHPRVQFDGYYRNADQAAAGARALLAEMETATDAAGWRFHPAMLAGETWFDEGEQDGGDALFRVSQDFQFHHEEI